MAETIKPILSVEGFNNQFLNAMRQEALMEDGKLIVHYSKDGQPEAVSVRFTESSVSSVAYLDSLYELYHWEKMNVDTLVREVMRNVRAMKPLEFTVVQQIIIHFINHFKIQLKTAFEMHPAFY